MKELLTYLRAQNLDIPSLVTSGTILLVGSLIVGLFARFIFGKKSTFSHTVSSAIGIVFLYALTVILSSLGTKFQFFVAPLPYVTIADHQLVLFSFTNADKLLLCGEILRMIILSFCANLIDIILPRGKHILSWLFFRTLMVLGALALHLLSNTLLTVLLPQGILTYAPPILLCLLLLMLLTGSLRFLVGIALIAVNPVIAALYTFFFANLIGRQLTKAVFTAALITGLLLLLQYAGISTLSVVSTALLAYIPFALLLAGLWYAVCRYL